MPSSLISSPGRREIAIDWLLKLILIVGLVLLLLFLIMCSGAMYKLAYFYAIITLWGNLSSRRLEMGRSSVQFPVLARADSGRHFGDPHDCS